MDATNEDTKTCEVMFLCYGNRLEKTNVDFDGQFLRNYWAVEAKTYAPPVNVDVLITSGNDDRIAPFFKCSYVSNTLALRKSNDLFVNNIFKYIIQY